MLTCVARCGLNNNALARSELSLLLGDLDHALRDTVLDRASGRGILQLANYS